jgi:hypothetical protein
MIVTLTACGDSSETEKAEDKAAAPAEVAAEKSTMEAATEMASKAVGALKLDTSSFDAFKTSLAEMKDSLSEDDRSKLMEALGGLVASETEKSDDGLLRSAKKMASNAASGKSATETLYEQIGDKLDGLTFEEILKLEG